MRNFKTILRITGAALAIGAASLPQIAFAQQQAETASSDEASGEIIVTAQRREQNLQDVPVAVTALTGSKIADLGIKSSSDIATVVPNLEIGLPGGEGNQPLIYIRGVGLADTNSNNSGPNGVYVDEVYISSPGAQTFQLFDLDRVEVLKGPQGTLYGRNATGGAINFITAKPGKDFEAQASLSYASFNTVRGEAAIGGPLSDSVRFRLSGTGTTSDGYVHNLLTGRRENGQGSFALRGQLAIDLSDDVDLLVNVHGGKVNVRAPQYRSLGLLDPASGFTTPCAIDAILANQCGNALGYVSPSGFYDGYYDRSDKLNVENWGASARLTWKLGAVTLTSITAYDYNNKLHREDTDASPLAILAIDYGVRSDTVTQELRLSGSGDRINWVFGGYYLSDVLKQNQTADLFGELRFLTPGGGADTSGATTGGAPVLFARTLNRQTTEAAAVFGQIEYRLAPSLRATLGGRYNYERKHFLAASQFEEAVIDGTPVPGGILPLYAFDNRKSFENVSFKVGLDYDLAKDVMAYASVSTGFKSGGFNAVNPTTNIGGPPGTVAGPTPYDPEKVTSYEAGVKFTSEDRRVRVNLAVFQADYDGVQLPVFFPGTANSFTSNAASAKVRGIEIEPTWRINDSFQIYAMGSFETNKYTSPFQCSLYNTTIVNCQNAKLKGSIPTKTSVGFEFSPQLHIKGGITFNGGWDHHSAYFNNVSNTLPIVQTPKADLFNASVRWDSDDGHWRVALEGKNLANKAYALETLQIASPTQPSLTVYPNDPRTYDLRIRFNF